MIVIPAVDLRHGRCVRLRQGRPEDETVFGDDPVAMALRWQNAGAPRLHVVDLDGAFEGRPMQLGIVSRMSDAVEIPVQLGGGLRAEADVEAALAAGVDRAILGTAALGDIDLVTRLVRRYGDAICVGIDARDGRVAVRGWAETTSRLAVDLARDVAGAGVRRVIATDIATDGMLTGPNLESIQAMAAAFSGALIASGGVSRAEDVRALAAVGGGCVEGVIVGQALYAGSYSLAETPDYLVREDAAGA